MGSLIGIRRRIKSAKNIAQITRAMQMVSASKMKKAQDTALSSRPFTDKLAEIMSRVSSGQITHALADKREVKTALVILVATNKGLCGALNVNLYREYINFLASIPDAVIKVATLGLKAKWVVPNHDVELLARFDTLGEKITFTESRAVSKFAMDQFLSGQVDAVYLVFPKFISTLQNRLTVFPLLPLGQLESEKPMVNAAYTVEPNPRELIDTLLPYQVEMTVYQTILESRASEHSSRMVAMKSAYDNASDLIGNLTLDYNQARQSQVTSELLDVTTARMALE